MVQEMVSCEQVTLSILTKHCGGTCLKFRRSHELKNHNIANLNIVLNCKTSPPSTESLLRTKI